METKQNKKKESPDRPYRKEDTPKGGGRRKLVSKEKKSRMINISLGKKKKIKQKKTKKK